MISKLKDDLEKGFIAREMMVAFCKWFMKNKEMTKDNFFEIQRETIKKLENSQSTSKEKRE